MTAKNRGELRRLEGQTVSLAISGGTRMDDVALVSVGLGKLWVYANGQDVFIALRDVLDCWSAQPVRSAA